MERKHGILHWLAVSLLAVVVAGCGADGLTGNTDSTDNISEMVIDLADPYGGLSSNDEEPAFGESYFSSVLTEDEPVITGEEPIEDERATVLFLRAVWGRVSEAPETNEETDDSCGSMIWDGSFSTSDGNIRPISTIRFERFGDYADALVLPREDRSVLEWTSVTGCGRDGVLIALIVPAPGDSNGNGDGLTEDDMVTFATGPLTISFQLNELAMMDSLIMVDEEIGVAFTGFKRGDQGEVCRRGHIVGGWHHARGDSAGGGYFRAAWLNPVGQLFGHIRGRYGVYEGKPVFRGKLINRTGGYEGHMVGVWDGQNRKGGGFRANWVVVHPDEEPLVVGGMRGKWHAGRGDQGGWMRGRWAARCGGQGDGEGNGEGNGGGNGRG